MVPSSNGNNKTELDWTPARIKGQDDPVFVSNPRCPMPSGLTTIAQFVTDDESQDILLQVEKYPFRWEGFEQRKMVRRFEVDSVPPLPSSLQRLVDCFEKQTGKIPSEISVEEYPLNQLKIKALSFAKGVVTTFESPNLCSCKRREAREDNGNRGRSNGSDIACGCFVAEIPLCTALVEQLNLPKQRVVNCWDHATKNHWTGLLLQSRVLYLKTNESLWEWRHRISSVAAINIKKDERAVLIKLRKCPKVDPNGPKPDPTFGYVPEHGADICKNTVMPPIEDLLTVIVTTSPIKSNPSTEVLERTFDSFVRGGNEFAFKCRKIIVCDGCRQKDASTSRRHSNIKQAMRSGIVDAVQLANYQEFKASLKELCASATSDSMFTNTRVEELEIRQGYGFALRHALYNCVDTPYVIVIQHDRTFMRPTPLADTLRTMWQHPDVKYVGLSQRSNLIYRDIFLSKYGTTFIDEMSAMTIRPSELALDASLYGPNSASTAQMEDDGRTDLRDNIELLRETYQKSEQQISHERWLTNNPPPPGICQLSLTPTFFWYDNIHICETAQYRDFIFSPEYKMVARGGFVEDKVSPVIRKTVERLGIADGHSRFGCFILDDHSGMFFTGHLDGGNYVRVDQRKAVEAAGREQHVARGRLKCTS